MCFQAHFYVLFSKKVFSVSWLLFCVVLTFLTFFSDYHYGFMPDCLKHLPTNIVNINLEPCRHIPNSSA